MANLTNSNPWSFQRLICRQTAAITHWPTLSIFPRFSMMAMAVSGLISPRSGRFQALEFVADQVDLGLKHQIHLAIFDRGR